MDAKIAIADLRSLSPYSQSRPYEEPKLQGESFSDYEVRTWRERIHANHKGEVIIPPMAFKNALSEAAKFLSISIPGKGKSTYTKHFEAGVLCVEEIPLGIRKEHVEGEKIFVPSDGVRGSGHRVYKWFPVVQEWRTHVSFIILDDTVLNSSVEDPSKTVFQVVLEKCGSFIGIGRFRPRNNGFYGRFTVESFVV